MQARLALELLLIFIGLPLAFDQLLHRGYRRLLFPGMWALGLWACRALARDPAFDWQQLLVLPKLDLNLAVVLVRMALAVLTVALAARRLGYAPPEIPPALRLLIFTLYPLLSVIPQGLIWRVFFVQRYAPLFGSGVTLLIASALAFAFAHIIFRNPIAVAVTIIGGACFAHTYLSTGSMLLADFEHAIDGLAVFSFGLGRFLYLGAARKQPSG
jgi:CAAX protease family protein